MKISTSQRLLSKHEDLLDVIKKVSTTLDYYTIEDLHEIAEMGLNSFEDLGEFIHIIGIHLEYLEESTQVIGILLDHLEDLKAEDSLPAEVEV